MADTSLSPELPLNFSLWSPEPVSALGDCLLPETLDGFVLGEWIVNGWLSRAAQHGGAMPSSSTRRGPVACHLQEQQSLLVLYVVFSFSFPELD